MNNTFSSDKSALVHGGFGREQITISEIDDNSQFSDLFSLNKMGSSIPTPFARFNLFNAAFRHVNETHANPAKPTPHNFDSNYHKMVSLCLDMIEFVYKYGDSKNFKISRWDKNAQTSILKNSNDDRHRKFGEALDIAFSNGGYGQAVYLFYYNDKLIGGTSPYTLVYTSPNVNETFPGLGKHQLFDINDPKALHERAWELKAYLHKLHLCYNTEMGDTPIGKYIAQSLNSYERGTALETEINALAAIPSINQAREDFQQNYTRLTDDRDAGLSFPVRVSVINPDGTTAFAIRNIPMLVKDNSRVNFASGYYIKPTVALADGAHRPLALSDNGCDNIPYIDDSFWEYGALQPAEATKPINERILPNSQIQWPYLVANDFLQEKIIEVSYNINDSKFYSGSTDKVSFLLPLKREFFKYFKPEDIAGMMSMVVTRDDNDQTTCVSVNMLIPIDGGQIAFSKDYRAELGEIVDTWDAASSFDLALFPFFKDSVAGNNQYQLMLGHSVGDISLDFYTLDALNDADVFKPVEKAGAATVGQIEKSKRSTIETYKTDHYSINKAFDIIEVHIGDSTGLVLPHMKDIDSKNAANKFTFCIDFGTTNTHIAYSLNNAAPNPLTINYGEDEQVVYLNDHRVQDGSHLIEGGFANAAQFLGKLKQEFVIPQMRQGFLPMNTVLCEKRTDDVPGKLFAGMNVAFYAGTGDAVLDSNTGDNRYIDDLKWNADDAARDRMRIYFVEMLMIMKHKSLLNEGTKNFNLVVTYPQAMQGNVKQSFKDAWEDAAQLVGLDPTLISYASESVAPYYSFSRKQSLPQTYVNMDIGGGSTDILYNEPGENGQRITYSVSFASNDIWGDGCNPLIDKGQNGFVAYFDRHHGLRAELAAKYGKVKNQWGKSSSIINQLFKTPEFRFTDKITSSRLIAVPILHFTSLIYYLSLAIKRDELLVPKHLTFTGMGSKYIKMIAKDEVDISNLINVILGHFLGTKVDLKVIFAPSPKEVTADGGVMISTAAANNIRIIVPDSSNVIGLKQEDIDSVVIVENVLNGTYKDEVLAHYQNIVDLLSNRDFKQALQNISSDYSNAISYLYSNVNLMDKFNESYDTCVRYVIEPRYSQDRTGDLNESMFFWPLKDGLYQIGVELARLLP